MKKVEQAKLKFSRMKEIIKIGEINEKQTKETMANIIKTKSWSFEKIFLKNDKPLAWLIKTIREKVQINKIINEKAVTIDTAEIQRIIRDY